MNGAVLTGLRRALGASRKDIMRQHLTEVMLIGLAGGALGLLLAVAGLAGIRAIYFDDHNAYERLTSIDLTVVLATLLLALVAGAAAGLYPSWRIGRMSPSVYLKSQ
jgi:putative ABC transport system permease protein